MASSLRILFLLATGVVVPRLHAQEFPVPDSLRLVQLEREWNDAHLRGDAQTLDRLWAEDLTVTVPSMPSMSKSESIGFARSGRMIFSRYETTDLQIRVYGDAAVVTGRLQRTRKLSGREVEDDWQFTKVYLHRGGRWKVVAFHASLAAP